MPKITPEQASRLLSGLSLVRMSKDAKQSIEAFLNAQVEAGLVDELQAQLQSLPAQRQAMIRDIENSVSQFNKRVLGRARTALLDIPDSYFETAADEAGLDD